MNRPGDSMLSCDESDVFTAPSSVKHRDHEFDPSGFDVLRHMQKRHFWYKGRHRFLLYCLRRILRSIPETRRTSLSAVDIGGGCGGWIAYLLAHAPDLFAELALADSSEQALDYSRDFLGSNVARYHVDLLRLPWQEQWDVVFLLDVLEHIPNDLDAMKQIYEAIRPGGCLVVTTPAFNLFWSYNDELAHHVRRYTHRDFSKLASASGFEFCLSRYFMFLLSPLLFLSRLKAPPIQAMTREEIRDHVMASHRVPRQPINSLLELIFSLETPLGAWLPFPWGTSILAVFRKPDRSTDKGEGVRCGPDQAVPHLEQDG